MNLNKDKLGKKEHALYGEWKPSLPSEALIYIKGRYPTYRAVSK